MYGWVPLLFTGNCHNIVSWLYSNTKCKIKSLKFERQTLAVEEHIPLVTAPPPCEVCHLLFTGEDTEPRRLAWGAQLMGDRVGMPSRAVWSQSRWWWLWCDPDEQLMQVYKLPWDREKHSWVPVMDMGWHVLLKRVLHFHVTCYFSPLENPCPQVQRAHVHPLPSSLATLCLLYRKHPARSCGKLKEQSDVVSVFKRS